jgi:hypothetical protein
MKRKAKQEGSRYGSIVSIRVTDDELALISGIRASTQMRTSDIMKEAFSLYAAQRGGSYGVHRSGKP